MMPRNPRRIWASVAVAAVALFFIDYLFEGIENDVPDQAEVGVLVTDLEREMENAGIYRHQAVDHIKRAASVAGETKLFDALSDEVKLFASQDGELERMIATVENALIAHESARNSARKVVSEYQTRRRHRNR